MKAIVLAGGFGTRLASVIGDIPKPMAPVGETPFLAILLNYLKDQGVTEVVIAVHHLKEKIIEYFGSLYKGMSIRYSDEKEPLGTGGGINQALSFFQEDEPILCVNGDSFLEISLQDLMLHYQKESPDLVIGLRFIDNCNRYGQAHLDHGRIIKFDSQGSSGPGFVNGGIYVLSRKLFKSLDLQGPFSFEEEILQNKLYKIKCGYVVTKGKFLDIGVPESYKKSEIFFKNVLREQQG